MPTSCLLTLIAPPCLAESFRYCHFQNKIYILNPLEDETGKILVQRMALERAVWDDGYSCVWIPKHQHFFLFIADEVLREMLPPV